MMAVDPNQGPGSLPANARNGGVVSAPSATTIADGTGAQKRRKRPSSLMAVAAALPTVESRLEAAEARIAQATEATQHLQSQLAQAKSDAAKGTAPTVSLRSSQNEITEAVAVERMKIAEAKAAKAVAAARAAAAGLTVSQAD